MEYNEDEVLYYYVRDYLFNLMTELEQRADRAAMTRLKANGSSPDMARVLLQRWGEIGHAKVNTVLADGYEAFRSRVVKRLLSECADKLILNRCPQCKRIVRTPKARQCFWCGHDWHS